MNKKVTLYFNDYCGHCKNLKAWFTKNNIPFEALNTEKKEVSDELVQRGITAIPFTVIENTLTGEKEEIIGFNEQRFENTFQ
ncbi:glutaredoxin family protein [Listeria monocytogenes]|uniref:glutaredoxin family protein n=1 Tax=Priestia TaxID=2800373 RepID=UPI001EB827B6|nr:MULTISPECIES: glutaredoxin family protein [Priestia]EGI2114992.1 glutaredoxin family protein [Listeria monocytogenes]MCU7712972.1 glutaredoxin family protein [Priestia megaterium]MCW1049033.1 glutaredoxin family protein [Priestia sp. JV24]MDN4634035.1 glutaredoxin family protein [Sphingomonas sp. PsM26]